MRILLLLLIGLPLWAQNANWINIGPSQKLLTAAKPCLDQAGNLYYLANGDSSQVSGVKWRLYKLNPTGQVLWSKVYGQSGNYAAAQIIHHSEKLYVVGERQVQDTIQAWVSVLDTSGAVLNHRRFGQGDTTLVGRDIAFNSARELVVLNRMRPRNGAPLGAEVLFLDSNLQLLGTHVQLDTIEFVVHEITADPHGNWVYVGDYDRGTRFDLIVTKIDGQGQLIKRVFVSNGFTRGGNAIDFNSKDQIVIGGEGASAFSVFFDVTLSILDTNLNILSDVFVRPGVPKNDACFDMTVSPNDTYLFTGYRISPENGETEMTVVESDSSGQRLHLDRFGSSSSCIGSGIVCDQQGNFYAIGSDFNQAPSLILAIGQSKGLGLNSKALNSRLQIYPNPSQGGPINIDGDFDPKDWVLVDALGRSINFEFQSGFLNFKGKAGLYFLQHPASQNSYRILRQ